MREIIHSLFPQVRPKLHEVSAYLIALSFCWVFLFHNELRQGFILFFSGFGSFSPFFLALGLAFVAGLLLSLAHPFMSRKKTPLEKGLMVWFVMGLSGVVSFFIGIELLSFRSSNFMVLPIWNIIMSVLLLIQMGRQKYDMSDEDASFLEIFGTTIVLVVILLLTDFYLRLSWAMTLSVCIFYSTTILYLYDWILKYFRLRLPKILNYED